MIRLIPIHIPGNIKSGDNLGEIITEAVAKNNQEILNGDIIVVAQKIVSKAEGRIVEISTIKPSTEALRLAHEHKKDPRLAEVILQESTRIVRERSGVVITETKHGFICANSGVDQSNIEGEGIAVLLPGDPDRSASRIQDELENETGKKIAVIITDTFGRPFRIGQTNIAIGLSGMKPIKSYIGGKDMYGKTLRVTEIAIADEVASAAELVMGKTDRVPAAIVRGYAFEESLGS
ncbi:MAG TPA: coenzyme F420-0:L-glutamate ligase, partial [Nitrososphaera sp.]|nr:coenzyme F420-0:L-glutamate ligase [Nitrososphaera sp.]